MTLSGAGPEFPGEDSDRLSPRHSPAGLLGAGAGQELGPEEGQDRRQQGVCVCMCVCVCVFRNL